MTIGSGTATLVNGAATISVPRIPSTAKVILTRLSRIGTVGDLSSPTITPNTSFTIESLNVLDNSTVHWVVMA